MKSEKESKRLELKRGGSEVRGRGAFSEFHAHFSPQNPKICELFSEKKLLSVL